MYFETLIEDAHPAIIETIIEDSVYQACVNGGEEVMTDMLEFANLLESETEDPSDEFEGDIENILYPYLENASVIYGSFLFEAIGQVITPDDAAFDKEVKNRAAKAKAKASGTMPQQANRAKEIAKQQTQNAQAGKDITPKKRFFGKLRDKIAQGREAARGKFGMKNMKGKGILAKGAYGMQRVAGAIKSGVTKAHTAMKNSKIGKKAGTMGASMMNKARTAKTAIGSRATNVKNRFKNRRMKPATA